jgi:predicted phosphodiesterase
MRYAIVSDLHANLAAWQTVLTDLADLRADQIICLGDVVGYGPNPVEVLESVYRVVNVTLMGNHDAAVSGRLSADAFTPRAAAAAARHRDLLSATALEWLARLPLTHDAPAFRCAHGDFSAPDAFNYIEAPEDALPSWRATPEPLLFIGHSHLPGIYVVGESGAPHFVAPCDFELEAGKRYIVNPGSVGYPRAGDRRSSYCLYDADTRSILFRQLPFDSAGYQRAMRGAGLDDDPWIQQKAAQQQRPVLRETPTFRKPGGAPPSAPPAGATPSTPRRRNRLPLLAFAAVAAALILAVGMALRAGRPAAASPAALVPPFDLSPLAVHPPVPSGKNLLPPLPPTLGADGRLDNWRYSFEDPARQRFRIGLRDGATTLCIDHAARCKAHLESPLIDLSGAGLNTVRLAGRVRKPPPFSGTAFYHLVTYTHAPGAPPVQHGVHPFEMRTSRRALSPPGAERDVGIKLGKAITHVRFTLEADFQGTLEIEQPRLTADNKEPPRD